jgi:predicted ATPase
LTSTATRCFVITGPPGSGKTPLIEHLVASGFTGVPEPARAVLAEQRATSGRGTHDRDPDLFFDLMFQRSLDDFVRYAGTPTPVFFDRGLPDLVGYAALFGRDSSDVEAAAARHRYNETVFVLPSWPEIYVTDAERRMSFDNAAAFGEHVRRVYDDLGYALVELPRAPVVERASLVIRTLIDGGTVEPWSAEEA